MAERTARIVPAITRATPTASTIGRLGSAASSTNPVRKVPKMAPAVPVADSPPTTAPVSARSSRVILATIGVTVLSTTAGAKKPRAARTTISTGPPPVSDGPTAATMVGASSTNSPPTTSAGPSRRTGGWRSASRPPAHAPSEIPASTVPMIPVNVSSVTPTYGARRRPARISMTSTAAAVKNTRRRAVRGDIAGSMARRTGYPRRLRTGLS